MTPTPFGNALRKAYLCKAKTTAIARGDVLFFYRSGDLRSLTTVGIVEDTLRTSDPGAILQFVGRRTVYTPSEIVQMTRSGDPVLAIRFRQDRFLDPRVGLEELQQDGVLKGPPQSITRVNEEGVGWLAGRVGAGESH